eukprot:CAMPEP_0116899690 /NCGR_PEP_ID=MMETSP0467-20121206/8200_1 /TAXON_ID=283647 /ORGANISM="Mesodinium pulex, Strain SPMC105" /LENGTH=63 /DNA_ID=CAMNT_0004572645 /DNA_START=61 /DNA_END=253 /DNA_ORIENTATION=-
MEAKNVDYHFEDDVYEELDIESEYDLDLPNENNVNRAKTDQDHDNPSLLSESQTSGEAVENII